MATPRRKHPGWSTIEETHQGRQFVALCHSVLGEGPIRYRPLERLKDGSHVFKLSGPRTMGILVEGKGRAVGSEWRTQWGFLLELHGSPSVFQADLVTFRWDPWLHAKRTGDATVRDSSPAKRRRMTDALRATGGSRKDRLIVRILPWDRSPRTVAGVPRSTIDEIRMKHGFAVVELLVEEGS
ncbi:MAG: hypothetical protein ACYC33_06890 [Thermoleophilia bacterium]